MLKWLVMAAIWAGLGSGTAFAQVAKLTPPELGEIAHARAVDFRIAQESGAPAPRRLSMGMLVSREVAAGAAVGIGLFSTYGKKSFGPDARIGGGPRKSRKPAVTFVMRF